MSSLLFLDLLNPCRICNIISSLLLLGLGVAVGGYTGKYLYVSTAAPTLNWSQVLTSDHFWTPDWTFWCFGLFTVVIIFCVVALINTALNGAWWCCARTCKCCGFAVANRLPSIIQRCFCCHCCFDLERGGSSTQSTTMALIESEYNEINRTNARNTFRV
jgi:hypothetical protein